jgi:cytoskeleton protein RodZ
MSGEILMTDDKVEASDISARPELMEDIGSQLSQARERMNLSISEVAKRLRMSVRQIQAMESQRWQEFAGPAIVKGFLRSYAKLLNLNPETLLSGFSSVKAPSSILADAPLVSTPLPRYSFNGYTRIRFRVGLLLAITLLWIIWLVWANWSEWTTDWQRRGRELSAPAITVGVTSQTTASAPPASVLDLAVPQSVPEPTPMTPAATVLPASIEPALALNSKVVTTQAPVVQETATLLLQFAADSWVEILEADNTVMARGLQPAASELKLHGKPPYRLLIGNAKHVTLIYQGKKIDLSPHIGEKVARLKLE